MKTALPAHEEYYRLTRARELHEKAASLERWANRTPLIAAWAAPLFFFPALWLGAEGSVGALAFLALLACLFRMGHRESARLLRSEAEALEAEHQARYGVQLQR